MEARDPDRLFDPARRAMTRARGADADDVVGTLIADSLLDRLSMLTRRLDQPLLVGARAKSLITRMAATMPQLQIIEPSGVLAARRGVPALTEERLLSGVTEGAYDAIVWPGGMESIDDVPGTLIQMRRALRPNGLLMGAVVGDGSWPSLRAAWARADGAVGVPRFHPQIDVRAVGDLLTRAGLVMPVIDVETVTLTYSNLRSAVADLRNAGLGRCLTAPTRGIDRRTLERAASCFLSPVEGSAEGTPERATETVRIIHLLAWSPGPDQPLPARRGSAGQRLADALKGAAAGR